LTSHHKPAFFALHPCVATGQRILVIADSGLTLKSEAY